MVLLPYKGEVRMIINCKYCRKELKNISPYIYEGLAVDCIKELENLISTESNRCDCKIERDKEFKDNFYQRWNPSKGSHEDVRYASYDENKYPYRKYLQNDCDDCPKNNGTGFDYDSLNCRSCLGYV